MGLISYQKNKLPGYLPCDNLSTLISAGLDVYPLINGFISIKSLIPELRYSWSSEI